MPIRTRSAAYTVGMNRHPPGTIPARYPATGTAVSTPGTNTISNFVPAAPTLPEPKIPRAFPFDSCGNHAEFQETPAEKLLPAIPNRIAQAISWPYDVAWPNKYVGIAVPSSRSPMMRRPPYASAQMPKFSLNNAPESIAAAISHSSCESLRPRSLRMEIPSTPIINQTLKRSVNATVDSHNTRWRNPEYSSTEVKRERFRDSSGWCRRLPEPGKPEAIPFPHCWHRSPDRTDGRASGRSPCHRQGFLRPAGPFHAGIDCETQRSGRPADGIR